jgi:excisionase family DNA binding protein
MSLPEAARRLGMHIHTLRRRIKADEIRAVRIGPRSYIPNTEIERLLNPPTAQVELSPNAPNGISENAPGRLTMRQSDAKKTQHKGLDEILAGYGDYLVAVAVAKAAEEWEELERDVSAGNPAAIAAKDALRPCDGGLGALEDSERKRAIDTWHGWWWRENPRRGPSSFIARCLEPHFGVGSNTLKNRV